MNIEKQKYKMVNNQDPNLEFELILDTVELAAYEALNRLGWSLKTVQHGDKLDKGDKMYYAIQDEVAVRCGDSEWIEGVFKDFFGGSQEDEDRVLSQITD